MATEYDLGNVLGPQGETGLQGVSITNVSVSPQGNLIVTLSSGTQIDAGNISGDKGEKGDKGKSAYQQAQEGGYAGTEAQFIIELNSISSKAEKTYVDTALEKKAEKTWVESQLTLKPNIPTYHVYIFVATSGNDITGNGSLDNPYKTIAKAISMLPRYVTQGYGISIALRGGTYNESNAYIYYTSSLGITNYNNESVRVNCTDTFLHLKGCDNFEISGIDIFSTATSYGAINIWSGSGILNKININCINPITNGTAINAQFSAHMHCDQCSVTGSKSAIQAYIGAVIGCTSITGNNNDIAFVANNGIIIKGINNTISATTMILEIGGRVL